MSLQYISNGSKLLHGDDKHDHSSNLMLSFVTIVVELRSQDTSNYNVFIARQNSNDDEILIKLFVRPSVHLSVCLSRSGIVLKLLDISS